MTEKRYSRMTNHYGTSRTYCTGVYDNQNNRELKNASQVITELNALHEENKQLKQFKEDFIKMLDAIISAYVDLLNESWEENEQLKSENIDLRKDLGEFEKSINIQGLIGENEQLKHQNELLSDELEQCKAVIEKRWSEYLKKKGVDGMTEKRFKVINISKNGMKGLFKLGNDNLSVYDVARLLNELLEENEQLKTKVDFYKYFQKDARELEKENEQLKSEIEELENKIEVLEGKLWNCQNVR